MLLSPRRQRSAFTLIELLVVIAIIAILIGLLLPAVQKVREAGARMECASNLKNIALACHAYHDMYKHLPRNGSRLTNSGCCSPGTDPQWSWMARILPFMEQSALYQLGGVDATVLYTPGSPNIANPAINAVIPSFFCPADSAKGTQTYTNRPQMGGLPTGLTNYRGVSGSNWAWGNWAGIYGYGNRTGNWTNNGLDDGNGIFFRGDMPYKVSLTTIRDGTSNTFMIGEDIPSLNIHCAWPYSNTANGTCAIPPNTNVLPALGTYSNGDWPNVYSFRSYHTGGLQFAMADGSVQFISQMIDINVYRALATTKGLEPVGVE